MAQLKDSPKSAVLPVPRTKEEARIFYNRVSGFYDWLAGVFERKYARMALDCLAVQDGEMVLEVGCGTGYCLRQIACLVGQSGRACGIDISGGMLRVSSRRLVKAGLRDRVELYCGDASRLPYVNQTFDSAFISFTLELFDTAEIPVVLGEVKRTLKDGGSLAVVSMSREGGVSMVLRLYEWAHRKWPRYMDCRPIYLEESIEAARYDILKHERVKLVGLPLEIVIARKAV